MADSVSISRMCNGCGHLLPADAPGGLCPVCIRREFLSAEPEAAPPPKPGDVFGDYELLGEIARGGMGIVHRAHQRGLDRLVALKLIDSRQESLPEFVARFETEARAAGGLDHPNVVPIYEIGEHDGRHFFTMKLVEGQSLAQRLSQIDNPISVHGGSQRRELAEGEPSSWWARNWRGAAGATGSWSSAAKAIGRKLK